MREKKENYCRWCDRLVNGIIQVKEKGVLTWVGCAECYLEKTEREKNEKKE